jgi:long-chain acyl-CoA synthetase
VGHISTQKGEAMVKGEVMQTKPKFATRHISDLKDMLEQSAKLFRYKDAFWLKNYDGNYRGVTFRDFKFDVDALGTAFIDMGLKDQFIAVIGENRYEWCVTYLATVNGTGVIVPLDKELPLNEIKSLLLRSNSSAIVFSGKTGKEVRQIIGSDSSIRYFIDMDLEEDTPDALSFRKLIEKGKRLMDQGDRSFLDAVVDPGAMNMLIFTSGTTDMAKGVMLSHRNICFDIMAVTSMIYIDSSDSVLSILPLHHTYECTCGFLVMIFNGCRISFMEGLKYISKNLREVKPSIILLVPLILENMYNKIWEQAKRRKDLNSSLSQVYLSAVS